MKKILLLIIGIIASLSMYLPQQVNAQSPNAFNYQAVARDNSGSLINDQAVSFRISILQGSVSGTSVYSETHSAVTNKYGLVNLQIGNGTTGDNFTAINWANGPYFVKVEMDDAGGSSYSLMGTSQLLSVPYALHAKTAETVTGTITETDPVFGGWDKSTGISITESQVSDLGTYIVTETDPTFTSSQAANITVTDITNLGNLTGTNTGDQDLSTLASKTALGDSIAQVRSEVPDVPTGTQTGEMQYWDGTAWVTVAAGSTGQTLISISGVPTWIDRNIEVDPASGQVWKNVISTTGEIWMDRNLGASQVATSSTDANAYGYLYQWGRAADGHESRTSGITSTIAISNTPGHGDFIAGSGSPFDWRNPQSANLWQGVSGTNNPCPSGYRLPTAAEWEAERESWGSNDAAGAFSSPLKLPVAGSRSGGNGALSSVGSSGNYWSSTVGNERSLYLDFYSGNAGTYRTFRYNGHSVRCLKD